ncbi:MAG: histidine phosphatase family protein [Polyangiaceae bacterium]|nr:histidine phosphatase family protein [Polyangiaceae bacterium]
MQVTRIFLVRHGETTLVAEDRFAGSTDAPLSDAGRIQAERLGVRLARESFAAVYASPMSRTMDTASLVGRPHGLLPIPTDGLREIDHGRWEGMRRCDVESQFAEEYAAWEEDPFTCAPEGGETGLAVTARALPVVRDIVDRHQGQQVLVVSHKATIRLLFSILLGFEPRGYRDRLDQLPCCLNIVDLKGHGRARLVLFNDVSHYASVPTMPHERLSKWWDPQEKP